MVDSNELEEIIRMLVNLEHNQARLFKKVELLGKACTAAFDQSKKVITALGDRQRIMNEDLCDMGGCVQNSHW